MVTEQRGDYSARLKLERPTNGSGCSSWPTVSANEDSYRINGSSQASKCLSGMAKRGELSWPTASSRDYKGAPQSRLTPEGYNARLDEAVIIYGQAAQANPSTDGNRPESSEACQRNWQTFAHGTHNRGETPHRQVVRALVTGDKVKTQCLTVDQVFAEEIKGTNASGLWPISAASAGKLNPRWVETLMGLPVGWTMPSCASPATIAPMNCGSSEMELFPPPQNEPSAP